MGGFLSAVGTDAMTTRACRKTAFPAPATAALTSSGTASTHASPCSSSLTSWSCSVSSWHFLYLHFSLLKSSPSKQASNIKRLSGRTPMRSIPLTRRGRHVCPKLSGTQTVSFGVEGAFGKIDLLTALRANVLFFKFIRENFIFFPAFRAIANKRLQFPEFFEAGAMFRCCHGSLLNVGLVAEMVSPFNMCLSLL
jgi:hypothetical protein